MPSPTSPPPAPRPVAYASARMVAADAADRVQLPARAGPEATLATGWLAVLVIVAASAFDRFGTDQSRGIDAVGYLLRYPSALTAADAARWAVGPAVAAFAVGVFVAAALWHWPRPRLAWAAVLPAAAAAWLLAESAAGRLAGPSAAVVPLAATVVVQSAAVLLGTRFGRPVARWLAARLLPPGLRDLAVALWSGR